MLFETSRLCLIGGIIHGAKADQTTEYGNAPIKMQFTLPALSLDTTPVTVSMGSVIYRIPRNYLEYPDPSQGVFIRVTFPGFMPFTEQTRQCLEVEYKSMQPGCTQIKVNLTRSGLDNAQIFKNVQKLFRNPIPRTGPFKYEVYDVGPDNARVEYYRKEDSGRLIFFHCFISLIRQERTGVCDEFVKLEDNNSVRIRFQLSQIGRVPEIALGITNLMDMFRRNGSEP
jgi:hypothetical protein